MLVKGASGMIFTSGMELRILSSLKHFVLSFSKDLVVWGKMFSYMTGRHNVLVIVTSSTIDCDVINRMKTKQVRNQDDV